MTLSPFEEESTRRLGLLAGDPQTRYQRHGALWEVIDGPPINVADEPRDSNVARLIRARLRIVDSASIALYDPLRDAPGSYIELAEFGERIWLNGVTWNDGLVQETVEFHEKYGPLVPNESPTAPPVRVFVLHHWLEACRIALAFMSYQSMRPEETLLRSVVIERIIQLFSWDLALFHQEQEPTRQVLQNRMVEWSTYKTRYDADQSDYTRRASVWLIQTINLCLDGFGVRSQVAFTAPGSWLNSYVAPTLGGALWGQLANLVLEGSTIKRCKFCQKQFATQNHRKDYCSDRCKENRKKRERRRRGL